MTMRIKLIACLSWVLAAPLAWAAEVPNASELLADALGPANLSYQGCMMIRHDLNKPGKGELVNVWFRPPSLYRWEFLTPDGKVSRVRISDGHDEQLHLIKSDTTLVGDASHSHSKKMGARHEFDLLAQNYDMVLRGVSMMAGQETYMVDLVPKRKGRPTQRIWIDQDSNIILGSQRSAPEGHVSHESHFIDFHQDARIPAEFFQMVTSVSRPAIAHGYDPDFLSDDELIQKTGRTHHKAPIIPGFEMESVDSFISDGSPVAHYRYTDGLTTLSLFETEKPARFSEKHSIRPKENPNDVLFTSDASHVVQQKSGSTYLILIGDLPSDELQELFQAFR